MELVSAMLFVGSPAGVRHIHHVCGDAFGMERKFIYFYPVYCFLMQNVCFLFLCSQIDQVVPISCLDFKAEGTLNPWLTKEFIHVLFYSVVSYTDPLDIHTGVQCEEQT